MVMYDMEPMNENRSTADISDDRFVGMVPRVFNWFELLNNDLVKLTQTIEAFNDKLTNLNSSPISVLSIRKIFVDDYYIRSETGGADEPKLKEDNTQWHKEKQREQKSPGNPDIVRSLTGIHKMAASTQKVIGEFEELSPKVRTVTIALSTVGDLSEKIAGISGSISTVEKGVTVNEGITAASGIMAGAVGIGETGAALGPQGCIAGLSALVMGGAVVIAMKGSEDEATDPIEVSPDRRRYFFTAQERQNVYEKQIAINGVNNVRQLIEVSEELDKKYIIADRKQRVEKIQKDWERSEDIIPWNSEIEYADLKNKWRTPGKSHPAQFDWNNMFSGQIPPPADAEKLTIEVENLRKQAKFDVMEGKVDMVKLNKEILAVQKKYKPVRPQKELVWRIPTEEEWMRSKDEKRKQLDLPMPPEEKEVSKRKLMQEMSGYAVLPGVEGVGRVININLNRPMIEHFTINTKDAKEGLNDFKHKVEEVLLEILNSANAIK